jgi:hypothetical protein
MKTMLALLATALASTSAFSQNYPADDLARHTIERRAGRGRDLGHAGSQYRPDAS